MKYAKVFFSLIVIITLAGCATLTTGPTQKVPVTSNPSGATARVDGGAMTGTTPTEFLLERKSEHIIEISKRGYRTTKIMLKRTMCGSTAGNMLIGGIIGVAVDAGTGSIYKLVPEKVHADLQGIGASRVGSEVMYREPVKRRVEQRPDARPRIVQQEATIQQPVAQGLGVVERLKRLDDLYNRGAISEAKYNEEKENILQSDR